MHFNGEQGLIGQICVTWKGIKINICRIHTREINKILSTEMDVLRRSTKKSRMERTKNERIKEIMGVKGQPDITDIIEKKDYSGMALLKGCQRREYQN